MRVKECTLLSACLIVSSFFSTPLFGDDPESDIDEGWCYIKGEIFPASKETCSDIHGRFFPSREEAEEFYQMKMSEFETEAEEPFEIEEKKVAEKKDKDVWPVPAGRSVKHDFNGDGMSDILWRTTTVDGGVYIWIMDGATLHNIETVMVSLGSAWHVSGVADFDGDRKSDILFHNYSTGYLHIWFMDGAEIKSTDTITLNGSGLEIMSSAWQVVGLDDFNGDGKSDILWRQSGGNGGLYMWLMDGVMCFKNQAVIETLNNAWVVSGTGDFDNDERADILFVDKSTGHPSIWFMNGTTRKADGKITMKAEVPVINPTIWKIIGTGRYNNDGVSDILWLNVYQNNPLIWFMDGLTQLAGDFIKIQGETSAIGKQFAIERTADFNGDGLSDILWRNKDDHKLYIWFLNGLNCVGMDVINQNEKVVEVPSSWEVVK